jgi:hypothetical protein
VKLQAFLQRYCPDMDSLLAFSMHWNDVQPIGNAEEGPGWPELLSRLQGDLPKIIRRSAEWKADVLANGDLTSNLLKFAASLRALNSENTV